ncbi:unnamed protein product [Cyclocybe aegerita]|uniref:Uncharacterized protein n=1 Tax=Cyclocybe aegerita TaxID=1973307 RepID=A0A8S0VTH3_CYCAE|nr:unnamed protein product [Cyclocybe aegerita]
MRRLNFLPTTLKARLALAGALTLLYVVASTLYIRGYGSSLKAAPEVLQSDPIPIDTPKTPAEDTNIPPPAPTRSQVLIVSAFFPDPTSPFTKKDYDVWLPNFLGPLTSDIYLYTTPELEPRLRPLQGRNLTLTIDTTYASPLEIPPLKGKEEMYKRILKKDRNKSRRSIELYANRNAKAFFLSDAVKRLEEEGRKYQYAFWSDAGSFRTQHVYREWPSLSRLQDLWEEGSKLAGTKAEDMLFIPILGTPHTSMVFWTENMGPIDNGVSISSFFGGSPQAIDWYARTYYAYHDLFLSLEIFVGKDQALINALLMLFPERFLTVWAQDPDAPAHLSLNRPKDKGGFLGQCGTERFYYQFFLSDNKTQEAMQRLWVEKASRWRWWGWWRWRDTEPCRTTRVLAMKDVLKRKLGEGWNPPRRTLNY